MDGLAAAPCAAGGWCSLQLRFPTALQLHAICRGDRLFGNAMYMLPHIQFGTAFDIAGDLCSQSRPATTADVPNRILRTALSILLFCNEPRRLRNIPIEPRAPQTLRSFSAFSAASPRCWPRVKTTTTYELQSIELTSSGLLSGIETGWDPVAQSPGTPSFMSFVRAMSAAKPYLYLMVSGARPTPPAACLCLASSTFGSSWRASALSCSLCVLLPFCSLCHGQHIDNVLPPSLNIDHPQH